MVFSNLLFVYLFLPFQMIFYYAARSLKGRNAVLLVFSLIFYAWGEPKYVLLLVGMSFVNWILSKVIVKNRGKPAARAALIAAIVISLLLLGIFKYAGFAAQNLQALTGFPKNIPLLSLPIGISFYTFQLLTYVVDVYRRKARCATHFYQLLLYASLFHQCIAGPIVRYSDISEEIMSRDAGISQIGKGISRFAVGLAKKSLLANSCGMIADEILLADSVTSDASALVENLGILSSRPAALLWLGVLMFMLQIYLDFSAYSDMAIGMGLTVGFHYKENFDYPYACTSVTDFWRCWHISLGTFFRDYVYIPLGGSRRGKLRTILNLFIVWALTGLWHGASWNFVLWGLYFFILLTVEKLFLLDRLKRAPAALSHLYLLAVVYFGWILFRFTELSIVGTVIKGLFCLNGNTFASYETGIMYKSNIFFIIAAVVAVTPFVRNLGELLTDRARYDKRVMRLKVAIGAAAPAVLLLLSTMALVGDSYDPFLYFQF